jgi:osmotically-inducible protein OsmY
MKVFLALLVGVAIGAAALWYFYGHHGDNQLPAAANSVENAAKSARDSIEDKMRNLRLGTNDIKDELARTGKVVREKAREAGQAIAAAAPDVEITAKIKAKLVADRDLSALSISVNTTDGLVTLSGQVSQPEDVGKAIALALDVDGVKQVTSTLQVKPPGGSQ